MDKGEQELTATVISSYEKLGDDGKKRQILKLSDALYIQIAAKIKNRSDPICTKSSSAPKSRLKFYSRLYLKKQLAVHRLKPAALYHLANFTRAKAAFLKQNFNQV